VSSYCYNCIHETNDIFLNFDDTPLPDFESTARNHYNDGALESSRRLITDFKIQLRPGFSVEHEV
jgi:hypothetical protein